MTIVALLSMAQLPALAQEPPPPAPPPPPPRITISGYVQVQYTNPDDANDDDAVGSDRLQLRRVRLRARGEVIPKIGYTVMIDPSTPGNLLRDAFVSLGFIPHHQLRIGQQKTQFGYENRESSTRLLTLNRALVSDELGRGRDLRDIGLGLFGDWELGGGLGVDYQLTAVNGAGPNVTQDDTEGKSFWGRLGASWGTDVAKARVGGSVGIGDFVDRGVATDPMDDEIVDFTRFGVDVVVDTPWLWAAFELMRGTTERLAGDVDGQGFYVTLVGKLPWRSGVLARVDQFDADVDAGGDRFRRWTVGAYHDLEAVKVRLVANYEIDDSEVARDNLFLLWGQVMF